MPDAWYNPNSPGILGPEWTALRSNFDSSQIGPARGFLQRWRTSSVAETVGALYIPSLQGLGGRYAFEVFPAGAELAPPASSLQFAPNRADTLSNVTDFLGSVTPATLAAALADGNPATGCIFTHPAAGTASIDLGFPTAGIPGRILAVGCLLQCTGQNPGQRFRVQLVSAPAVEESLGDVPMGPPSLTVPTFSEYQTALGLNFWTGGNIASYGNALPARRVRISLAGANMPGDFALLSEVRMIVVTCAETRLTSSVWSFPAHVAITWVGPAINWAKPTDTDLSLVVRPLDASAATPGYRQGDFQWLRLDGFDPMTLGAGDLGGAADVAVDAYGRIVEVGPINPRRVHPFAMRTPFPAAAGSIDTMPYVANGISTPVGTAGGGVFQEVTNPPGADREYRWARLVVARAHDFDPSIPLPTEHLLVSVVRVSDSVVMASGYVDPADFLDPDMGRDLSDGWRQLDVLLQAPAAPETGAILAAGANYRIQVASIEPEVRWYLTYLLIAATGYPVGAELETASFGGQLDVAGTFPPVVGLGTLDGMMALVQRGPAVEGFTAELGEAYFENVARCGGNDAVLPYAKLRWTPRPIGELVAGTYYEIARRDPTGDRWLTIYRLDAEAGSAIEALDGVEDFETWPDAQSAWRIRFVGADGALGDWSDPATLTITGGPLVALVSNARPWLNFAADDVGLGRRPRRAYEILDQVQYRALESRPYWHGMLDRQLRGKRFSRTLRVADAAPAVGSVTHFDALQRICRLGLDLGPGHDPVEPLPYICVRERNGGRFFCGAEWTEGEIIPLHNDAVHLATVTFTEVRGDPVVVER